MRWTLTVALFAGLTAGPALAGSASFTGSYTDDFQGPLGTEWSGLANGSPRDNTQFRDGTVHGPTSADTVFHTWSEDGNRGISTYKSIAGADTWFQLSLTNDTGADINSLDIAFDAQVFGIRQAATLTQGGLAFFELSTGSTTLVKQFVLPGNDTGLPTGTWFTDAVQSANSLVESFSETVLLTEAWGAGEQLDLRWVATPTVEPYRRVNIGIDDLSITTAPTTAIPSPDPASAGLALLGVMGLLRRRRR